MDLNKAVKPGDLLQIESGGRYFYFCVLRLSVIGVFGLFSSRPLSAAVLSLHSWKWPLWWLELPAEAQMIGKWKHNNAVLLNPPLAIEEISDQLVKVLKLPKYRVHDGGKGLNRAATKQEIESLPPYIRVDAEGLRNFLSEKFMDMNEIY